MDTLDRIIQKLSVAQRDAMKAKMYRYEISPYRRTGDSLVKLGLLTPGKDFQFWETYRFTALGKQVRGRLFKKQVEEIKIFNSLEDMFGEDNVSRET